MVTPNVKREQLRKKAARKGIFTLRELARRVPCSYVALYGAIERPTRFGRVTQRIKEITE